MKFEQYLTRHVFPPRKLTLVSVGDSVDVSLFKGPARPVQIDHGSTKPKSGIL
jgi:hypothetical protein